MGKEFDPLSLSTEDRRNYSYEGPEIIYVFWAKHGPCQVTGCGHRTPIMTTPVMAARATTIKAWPNHRCPRCRAHFDIEESEVRMAPGAPFVVGEGESAYSILVNHSVKCPHCGHEELVKLGKGKNKKVELTVLVHPKWLAGSSKCGPNGREFGGSVADTPESTIAWNRARAGRAKLIEFRGALPDEFEFPEDGLVIKTNQGSIPRKSHFTCAQCGSVQDALESIHASKKAAPVAAYAYQGYCPYCESDGQPFRGKFFAAADDSSSFDHACLEWTHRKNADLGSYWPQSPIPFGFMTGIANGDIREGHGFTHWWTMFNPRQLLVQSQLLRAISITGEENINWETREFVLGAFQQYLRNQNMFCFWNPQRALEPLFSNNNFHPKGTTLENGVFSGLSRGDFRACSDKLLEALTWRDSPWDIACLDQSGHSEKVTIGDSPLGAKHPKIESSSASALSSIGDHEFDLVVTDPPFGGLLHYSELSDFFYVWLQLVLKDRYPDYFSSEYTPKALEAVSNRARQPEDPDGFYKRLLTECWREAHRILKPGGILSFTFHHSEDEPWVAVLESLFDAGFWLEATYPIRSDESKGEGEFGSKKIEYDIIHVCRKRTENPTRVSWGRMRRQVLEEVRQIQSLLEHHVKAGLPAADLQVIKRGKALEYFSRHYGMVFVDENRILSVTEAVAGINQILDEESGRVKEPPPVMAEPLTRQLLRIFEGHSDQPRDQVQKYLRGTGIPPEEFEQRGWCGEDKKIFHLISPLEIAKSWYGRQRKNMTSDYDQAMFLIGACYDGSGINAMDTISNQNFRPHPALAALLEWHSRRAANQTIRNAAARALAILHEWERTHQEQVRQLKLEYGE